jgi:ribosome biogenesis ATPase
VSALYGEADGGSAGFCTETGKADHSFLAWVSESDSAQASLEQLFLTFEDFKAAHKLVLPSALKEGFATVPNVSFDDIGALDDLREELEMAICAPVHDPEVIEKLGMDVPSGVLLCGPPGCGKTLLAKAVANQAGINFISVKGPEIINMVRSRLK